MNLIGDEHLGHKISNEVVVLSELTSADINDHYLETLNDFRYMKYSRHKGKVHSFSSQVTFIESSKLQRHSLFKISTVETKEFCGVLSVIPDFQRKNVILNLLVFKNFSGQGYGFYAMKAMCEYLDLRLIDFKQIIGTNIENKAMQEIAKKMEFIECNSENFKNNDLVYFKRNRGEKSIYDYLPSEFSDARRIYVASCDAGASYQIYELLSQIESTYWMKLDGPAMSILANKGFNEVLSADYRDILECDLLLSGSGWMSSLEREAVEFARKSHVPTYCLLDHFVNYPTRFGNSLLEIPDGFISTNRFAFEKAKGIWINQRHYLIPDFQIARIQQKVFLRSSVDLVGLFVLDIVASNNAEAYILTIADALIKIEYIYSQDVKVRFRLHPAQPEPESLISKLKSVLGESTKFSVLSLEDDLISSQFVVGTNSYALFVANSAGIKTYITEVNASNQWVTEIPGFHILDMPR